MARVRFADAAADDVIDVAARFLEETGEEVVPQRFLRAVATVVDRLGRFPLSGSLYSRTSSRLRGVRRLPLPGFSKLLVFHSGGEAGVLILGVLHASRDLPPLLEDRALQEDSGP